MTDASTIVLITKRLIEAMLLAVVVSGILYICLNLIFGDDDDKTPSKIIKSFVNILIIPFMVLIFVNVPVINSVILIIVAAALVAASLFSYLSGPLKIDEKSTGFWVLFILLYSGTLYVIIKEILK